MAVTIPLPSGLDGQGVKLPRPPDRATPEKELEPMRHTVLFAVLVLASLGLAGLLVLGDPARAQRPNPGGAGAPPPPAGQGAAAALPGNAQSGAVPVLPANPAQPFARPQAPPLVLTNLADQIPVIDLG